MYFFENNVSGLLIMLIMEKNKIFILLKPVINMRVPKYAICSIDNKEIKSAINL